MSESYIEDKKKKFLEWVHKTVPSHTRWEYEELLRTKQELAFRLMDINIAYEELTHKYKSLQKEVYKSKLPVNDVTFKASAECEPIKGSKIFSFEWDIKPVKYAMRVGDLLSYREDVYPFIRNSIKEVHFRDFAKMVWPDVERNLNHLASLNKGFKHGS